MANSTTHGSIPFVVKGARFSILVPYLDADGDPTDPTTPDTEVSKDAGSFADCTEEVTTITGSNGMGYITLTGDETNCTLLAVAAKVASGPKNTLLAVAPRILPVIQSGTAQAGAAGSITLASGASAIDDCYIGCIVRTTGGTGGGGGSGSLNNQARVITDYVGSTKVATISPNWETNPDNTTTYEVLLTDLSYCVQSDVVAWRGTQPNTLVSNRVDASIGAVAANAITASGIADGAIDRATFAADTGLQASRSNTAQAGAATTITLDASASATTDFYEGMLVYITSGTGVGQARIIISYNGSTKVATVDRSWATNPDNTSTFAIIATDLPALDSNLALVSSSVTGSVGSVTGNVGGNVTGSVGSVASGGITSSSFASGAIDSAAIATDAIGSAELAASAITEIQSGLATSAALATVQADTDDIQSRLPAALVSGRIDASVGAMAANTLTASALATDAVTEIRSLVSGTSDSGTTTTMVDSARTESDTDYWKGDFILFTSGNIANQCRLITSFTPASDTITFSPATTQAVSTQDYEIIPAARVDLQSLLGSTVNALVSGRVDSSVGAMAADTLTASALATDAVTEIQSGLATSAALSTVQSDTDDIQSRLPAALVSGRIDASIGATASGVITSSSFASGAIDSAAIATDAIGSAELAASAITEIQSGLATSAALATVQADTDDIQSRLPAALVGGRMDSSIGAVAANAITASGIADGAIDRATFAADTGLQTIRSNTAQAGAATTITLDASASSIDDFYNNTLVLITGGTGIGQSRFITNYDGTTKVATVATWSTNPDNTSTFAIIPFDSVPGASAPTASQVATAVWTDLLASSDFSTASSIGKLLKDDIDATISSRASSSALATVQSDTDDIQSRLPAALVSGRIDASVGAMATDTLTSAALASSAVTEIQSGLATASALATVQADTDDIQSRLPAALVSGRMDSSIGAVAANAITASGIADGAIDRATFAADTGLQTIRSNTAQGGTSSYIILDSGASSNTDEYIGNLIYVTGGTGVGQVRVITAYNSSNKRATVDRVFTTSPDVTSTFSILATDLPSVNSSLEVPISTVGANGISSLSFSAGAITSSTFSSGAIDSNAIATDAIGSAELAASAITEIQSGLATASALATVQSDTDDIQSRLPAALVSGRMDSSVGAMATDTLTSSALASSAVTEIQTGLASSSALATVQADTDDIQSRLPAALVGGRMDASVGAMSANTLTASALATDAVTEIQTGLATSSALATVQADTDDIQSRLPAALVGGRMDSSVGAMAANVITSSSFASSAISRATFAADTGLQTIRSNTAQAGAATTITLDASASSVNDFYNNTLIFITGGTGVGQSRFISDYVGSTKIATVSTWSTTPDNTSTFAIIGFDSIPGASAPTAAQVSTAVWTDLLASSDFSTVSSIGKLLKDNIDAAISDIPSDVNTALSSAHGSGSWGSASGAGVNTVTLTFLQDPSATNAKVVGVTVSIKDVSETTLYATGITNSNGQVIFGLNDGSYHVLVGSSSGYLPFTPSTLVVSGTTTASYDVPILTIPTSSNPGLCSVYMYAYKSDGTPKSGLVIYSQLDSLPATTSTNLITSQQLSATTDSNGLATLQLIRKDQFSGPNKRYRIICSELGINIAVEIPNQSSADLRTLL